MNFQSSNPIISSPEHHSASDLSRDLFKMLKQRMLNKEDEPSNADEVPVRREDQEQINRFSRLHGREAGLEEQLRAKQKDKEDLEEVSNELELADEDDKVPYKIGDSYFSLPVSEVQELLKESTTNIDEEVSALETKLGGIREDMEGLKIKLYARFGRSINLES